jgi:hypothetical protein
MQPGRATAAYLPHYGINSGNAPAGGRDDGFEVDAFFAFMM